MVKFPQSTLDSLNKNVETFSVFATNSTSGNKISKTSKDVELIALAPKGITLEVPKRSCSQGHSFILQIEAHIERMDEPPIKLNTQVTGVITEIEGSIHDERFQVTLEFRQYSVDEWHKFLGHVENRQANLNKSLKEMKK